VAAWLLAGCSAAHRPAGGLAAPRASDAWALSPRWSPDGKRIAYLTAHGDALAVNLASADGAPIRETLPPERLANPFVCRPGTGLCGPDAPAWLPDSASLIVPQAAWSTETAPPSIVTGLALLDPRGGLRRVAWADPEARDRLLRARTPTVSPDGRHVTFVTEGLHGLCAVTVAPLARVTEEPPIALADPGLDADWPAWSPRGGMLAYRRRVLKAPGAIPSETLRVIQPGGAVSRTVAVLRDGIATTASAAPSRNTCPRGARIARPVWSPDAAWIVFEVWPNETPAHQAAVWLAPADGSRPPQRLSPLDGATYRLPVLRRTGLVLALRSVGERTVVVRFAPPGRPPAARALVALPGSDADWSPDRTRLAVVREGKRRGGRPLAVVAVP
jgi:dipeptidyl aminopeptidase/acylaminoacyl peptidase